MQPPKEPSQGRSRRGMHDLDLPPRKRRALGSADHPPDPPSPGYHAPKADASGAAGTGTAREIAPATKTTTSTTQRCLHCGTTTTPLWRKGPQGPGTLCNACGTRWKRHGSVALRRPIASSTPEAVAASAALRNQRQLHVQSPAPRARTPVRTPHVQHNPAAPASSRLRIRERKTLCPDCGGQITLGPDGAGVCEICAALNEAEQAEQMLLEPPLLNQEPDVEPLPQPKEKPRLPPPPPPVDDVPPQKFEANIQPHHPRRSPVSKRQPRPLVNEFTGEPVLLDPELLAAYDEPPQPGPWVAPKDDHHNDDIYVPPPDDAAATLSQDEQLDAPSPQPQPMQVDDQDDSDYTPSARTPKRSKSKRAPVYAEIDDDDDDDDDDMEYDDYYENTNGAPSNTSRGANSHGFKCHSCGTTETPLWRRGPAGRNTLCNACGTRWKRHGSLALDHSKPIARKRKPAIPRAALNHQTVNVPRSPPPPPRPRIHRPPSPEYEHNDPRTPVEAARDIPYLPALNEVLPGGVDAIIKEPKIKRSARLRKRTSRAKHFFDSLTANNTIANANSENSLPPQSPNATEKLNRIEANDVGVGSTSKAKAEADVGPIANAKVEAEVGPSAKAKSNADVNSGSGSSVGATHGPGPSAHSKTNQDLVRQQDQTINNLTTN